MNNLLSEYVRNNFLITLPPSLAGHTKLQVILLDNNLLTEIPQFVTRLDALKLIRYAVIPLSLDQLLSTIIIWISSCSGNILRNHDQFVSIRRSSYELIKYQERDSLPEIVRELESFTRQLPGNLCEHNIYVKQEWQDVAEQPSKKYSNNHLPEKLSFKEDAFNTVNRFLLFFH